MMVKNVVSADFVVKKNSKYKNFIVKVDGLSFDSKREAKRYQYLKLLKLTGKVIDFEVHPRYRLEINKIKICSYEADFKVLWSDNTVTVEDVKGFRTQQYIIKKMLMKALHNIDVKEF